MDFPREVPQGMEIFGDLQQGFQYHLDTCRDRDLRPSRPIHHRCMLEELGILKMFLSLDYIQDFKELSGEAAV